MTNDSTITFEKRVTTYLPKTQTIRDELLSIFEEILRDLGEQECADLVTHLDRQKQHNMEAGQSAQVHSICFQIQNLVEDAISITVQQKYNQDQTAKGESGFWLNYLHRLKEAGVTPEAIAARVGLADIEIVYTKHPTEAKRWIILHLHRELYSLIVRLYNGEEVRAELAEILELLWRSGELNMQKPTVRQERRNLEYYFSEVFPEALKQVEASFREAWSRVFPDTEIPASPRLSIASWVGGDRDGHPFVTADVTRESLMELRTNAIQQLVAKLEAVRSEVRFTNYSQKPPSALMEWLYAHGLDSQSHEPWLLFFERVILTLNNTIELRDTPHYASSDDFRNDIEALEKAFQEINAARLINRYVSPILSQLSFYGFHTARLDIRQNSETYRSALAEIIEHSDIVSAEEFLGWSEAQKVEFITHEFQFRRPFIVPGQPLSDQTQEVVNTFKSIRKHIDRFGSAGLGNLIVSMTQHASDLLMVYLFCKEVGLIKKTDKGMACQLPVVPLFETMADLQEGVGILSEFWKVPLVRNTLEVLGDGHGNPLPQTVMVGYSDSNKDCGIWTSQWSVYNAQKEILDLSEEMGVSVRFFHGRGGTVGRGSGPTHRFIEALPQQGLTHGFRITEQGEVIAQKYNSVDKAKASFEQWMAGVSCSQMLPTHDEIIERAQSAMDLVAEKSTEKYRSLIEAENFIQFYRQATPIDIIELSKIGSRPSRRTGASTIKDLRAIPWVFSWNQSRFYLPGWFGLGSGLAALKDTLPEGFEYLKSQCRSWPFLRYVLFNAESTVASCSYELMNAYANLVKETELRERFMSVIVEEYELVKTMLAEMLSRTIEEGRPRLYFTLKARDERLQLLHEQQIELLRQWRNGEDRSQEASDKLLMQLLKNINAVASGLKTTG